MNIEIRKARSDDLGFVFPMVYSSGPHEYDYVFNVGNKTIQDYFSFAFPSKFGTQSHRVFTVATVNDQVVGIGAFYCGNDNIQLNLGNFWNVLRFYGPIDLIKVAQNSSYIDTILPPPEADAEYIGQLGVKEEFRGCGIGTILIQNQIDLARKNGRRKCTLDVATTNPQAQKLYKRLGFKVIQENTWNYPNSRIHVPSQRRMELIF